MKPHLVYDPFVEGDVITPLGAVQTDLDDLLRESDFVSIHCPLMESTRQLISRRELSLMKPTAYLINTARGGIVDEPALVEALTARRIAGAALDCFVEEPLPHPHPLAHLDNVLLAPHAIAWTSELFRDIGRMCCHGLLDLASRRRPPGIVNPEVFERPSFQEKWNRLALSTR
jgi:phosphoglycerate dehydrogenase-like enzyme